jgi:hypothetical protein
LTTGSAAVSDVLEFAAELMLVTVAAAPTYTVSRGYYGTTAVSHAATQTGFRNPQWNRQRVAGAVRRAFPRLEALGVPLIKSTTCYPETTVESDFNLYIDVPEEVREVLAVRDDLSEIDHWQFVEDLPTSSGYHTGKVVRLPRWVTDDDDFYVTYRAPYRWSTHPAAPVEASTIDIPEGAEDLPSAYAAAWLCSAREISRQEIDRSTEWNQTEPTRGGVSAGLVRAKWQEFYRMLDEVRRIDPPPPTRHYMRKSRRGWWI